MSDNDNSDWANLSYDDYSEEEQKPITVKNEQKVQEIKEEKCISNAYFYLV
jgi:hypothetical protein